MLLTTAWFPPADWFALVSGCPEVKLEACESYRKQTWRNRCRILSANGPLDLRMPVKHGGSRLITDIEIDYGTPWLRQACYAIDSAYYNSPFFEFYRDPLFALLERRPPLLWDMNLEIIRFFALKLGLRVNFEPTESFVAAASVSEAEASVNAKTAENAAVFGENSAPADDWRESFSPKRPCTPLVRPYYQVFREKFGFVPGLSVMDLLFNEGPESAGYFISGHNREIK